MTRSSIWIVARSIRIAFLCVWIVDCFHLDRRAIHMDVGAIRMDLRLIHEEQFPVHLDLPLILMEDRTIHLGRADFRRENAGTTREMEISSTQTQIYCSTGLFFPLERV